MPFQGKGSLLIQGGIVPMGEVAISFPPWLWISFGMKKAYAKVHGLQISLSHSYKFTGQ